MSESHASLFAHRDFMLFVGLRVLSNVGYHMQTVAVGWLMFELTGDPLDLGLVGLVQFVPSVLLVLVVGQVADRFDRRKVVLVARLAMGLAAALLSWALASGNHAPGLLLGFVFWIGVVQAFHMPTAQAVTPTLVPPVLLARAIALSSMGFRGSVIIGPMIGGFLILAGGWVVFAVGALIQLLAALFVMQVKIARPTRLRDPVSRDTLWAGFRFIRERPVVLGAMSLDLFMVLLGGATALMPIFASEILQAGPSGLGLMRAAPGVGSVLMALWLLRNPLERRVGRLMFIACGIYGLCTIAFGLSPNLPFALVVLTILGAADMINVVIRQSIVQLDTPDEMRGRVASVNVVAIGASIRLGEFESGVTASWWGAIPATVVGGFGTLAVAVLWMRWFPALWRRERLVAGEDAAVQDQSGKARQSGIPS
ncbi:MAG: MFS transporter [Burkholderiaceae bacterium]